MSTKNAAASISTTIGNVTLELRQGNIALLDVDAVVNAANEYLNLGAGVAGAIREAGGEIIQKECHEIGFCPVGSAVMTSGGKMIARHVIHAVGPMYGEGNENEKLRSAISTSINLAEEKGLKSVAFPAIGAGFFHFPINECAKIIVGTIKDSAPNLKSVEKIVVCLHDDAKMKVFADSLKA